MRAQASVGLALLCGACGGGEDAPQATATAREPLVSVQPYAPTPTPMRWWKGNPHLDAPQVDEPVATALLWYRDAKYDFVACVDSDDGRGLNDECAGWAGPEFLLLDAQVLQNGTGLYPVDLVVLGAHRPVEPSYGLDARERAARNLAAVRAVSQTGPRPLACLAHPNEGWTFTAADLAALRDLRFVEVVSGRTAAASLGDESHPSVETLWDQANLARARAVLPLLFAWAGDDEFFPRGTSGAPDLYGSIPWIAVRAPELRQEALLYALHAGDFYASTGVALDDVRFDGRTLEVAIDVEWWFDMPACSLPDFSSIQRPIAPFDFDPVRHEVSYVTRFVGARRSRPEEGVSVLLETAENPARYTLSGDELFVRATVVSDEWSALDPAPECAWTQPVQPAPAR